MCVWHVPQSQHPIQGAGIKTHSVKGPDSTRTVTGKLCVFIHFMTPVVKHGVFNMFSYCTRIGWWPLLDTITPTCSQATL